METAAKYITIVALSICAGFFIATYALTNSTSHSKERSCDKIVRYEDGSLACIVKLQAEDDNITILEYK